MTRKLLFSTLILTLFGVLGSAQTKSPKTVRDFFFALPDKYFSLDCCMSIPRSKRKAEYLKLHLNIEDTANGYLSASGDAAQDGCVMALFKRPDGTYLIGFYTEGEGGVEDTPWTVFLDYRNGNWVDVSRALIPGYSKEKYIYELPRYGTAVQVYAKDEKAAVFYQGKGLYSLLWKDGKFLKGEFGS